MQLGGMDAAADRDADRERHGQTAAGAGPHAGRVRADLVVRRSEEALELDLRHRTEAAHRQPDRGADDAALREGRVDHAVRAEPLLQSFGDAEDAAVEADVLAEQDDAVILLHFLHEREVDRLNEGEVGHGG